MPKRMLDDSLLTSPSLAKCSPRAQDAFPRFILLADDFGCFEAFGRVLAARGWPHRTDVSAEDVDGWLEEYLAAGMACLWTENERRYCYLIGWDGPHGQRKRAEYDPEAPKGTNGSHGSKRRTPKPPAELIEAVKSGERRDRDGLPPGSREFPVNSREFPPGKPPSGNPNDSVPARESEVSREFPPGRAAPDAVPDAVPVPAAAPAGRLPTKTELLDKRHPATRELIDLLADQGFALGHPKVNGPELEAALLALRVEDVARGLLADLEDRRSRGEPEVVSLGFYGAKLIAQSKRAGLPPKAKRGDLGVVYGVEWWRNLSAAEVVEFKTKRQDIAPELDLDAPFSATGFSNVAAVEALISRYSERRTA